ncbi:MAG: GGDEF domain-containing protein [Xanthomonadales bacterium]|nr:GGDEF domain-containing protein [Xanthomonadales bacterium]
MERVLSKLLPRSRFDRQQEAEFAHAATVALWSAVCAVVCLLAAMVEFAMGGTSGPWLLLGSVLQVLVLVQLRHSRKVEQAAHLQVAAQMLWAAGLIVASHAQLVGVIMLLPFLAFMGTVVLPRRWALAWAGFALAAVALAQVLRNLGGEPWLQPNPEWVAGAVVRVPWLMTILSTATGLFFVHNYRTMVDAVLRTRTRERKLSAAHAALNERLQLISDSVPAAITYIDRDFRYRFNNEAYERWYGMPRSLITGRSLREVMGAENFQRMLPYLERAFAGERVRFDVALNRANDDSVRHLRGSYTPEFDTHGDVCGVVGMLLDVTRLEQANHELRRIATIDGLTDLANRYAFYQSLDQALEQAAERGESMALLYLDLDAFKQVNDVYGHAAGDQVLVCFGQRIRDSVRMSDLVARLAGDEFVVLMRPVEGKHEIESAVQRIRAAMAEPIDIGETQVRVETSIGTALACDGDSADSLLKRGDDALYADKRRRQQSIDASSI